MKTVKNKHPPKWLNPVEGHPAQVQKDGMSPCFGCHDESGSKCLSCHTYIGKLAQ